MRTQDHGATPWAADYIRDTAFATTLSTALEELHQALIRRWREHVCAAVLDGRDYPVAIRRETPTGYQPPWDHRHISAQLHLAHRGRYCAYVAWVDAGQESSLGSVVCAGSTGSAREDFLATGRFDPIRVETVPQNINCGMGLILGQVDGWAWGEREVLFAQLPLFDHHDQEALHQAHDDLVRLGKHLGLKPAQDSGASVTLTNPSGLPATVDLIKYGDTRYASWWAGWTGLLADTVGKNFFSSVEPTLNNQATIAGALANLYADRGRIIEKGRNDALHAIQGATAALGEAEMITTPPAQGWKVVQGIGLGVAVIAGWSVPGAVTAASVQLVGYLGELGSGGTFEAPAHDFREVVGRLYEDIQDLSSTLRGYEDDYRRAVDGLRAEIHRLHSYNLELYGFGQNRAEGRDRNEGFNADITSILSIAKNSYVAGEEYERLLPIIPRVSGADRHLAGQDGRPTPADRALIEVRELLHGFLKTAAGRYLIAGDMVKEAAEAYIEADDEQRDDFDSAMADWALHSAGEAEVAFDPEEYAEATDRSGYARPPQHPEQATSGPGYGDLTRPGVPGDDAEKRYTTESEE